MSGEFTTDHLMLNLRLAAHSAGYVLPTLRLHEDANFIADAIVAYDIADKNAGTHKGEPVTFAQGYEIVFGRPIQVQR